MARPFHGVVVQVRVCTRGTGAMVRPEELVALFDSCFRRATSVQRYVIRGETVAARREAVLWIAAVRHEPTRRADASILLLLRRALTEIERGKWILLEVDGRGFKTGEAVWADYTLVPRAQAETEMHRLESLPSPTAVLATTELPPAAFT